jgi:phage shock protein A|eukprot:COSAG01_NODE_780_length_13660_cov_171.194233_9_plen_229_part_00
MVGGGGHAQLEAAVEERKVQRDMCETVLAELRGHVAALEGKVRALETAMEEAAAQNSEEKQWQPQWTMPDVAPASHSTNLLLADQHSAAGLEHSGQEGGLMETSAVPLSKQLAALQRLYAAATAQADSARRQAEAATTLNEQLVEARSAPHHDANEDARRLIAALHGRVREQDGFISVALKRLAILEAFVREERELVVVRVAFSALPPSPKSVFYGCFADLVFTHVAP